MTDNSTTDKLESRDAPVAIPHTPPPMATPPVVAPESNVTPPDTTTNRIAAPNVTPPVGEAPRRDTLIDPRVVALRAMFPDYDDLILISVLESVGGNQDRAIDALLVMSDPEYKGEPPAAVYVQQEQPALSQTELDEQFARHLMLEEQQQQQQQWVNANQRSPQSRPSQQRWSSQAQPGEAGVEADKSVSDFQEQFSKFAESGKKTIEGLFTKVKAKIQEFDQGKSSGPTSGSSTQPTWGANTSTASAQGQAQSAAVTQPSYFDPNSHSSTSSTVSSPPVAHTSPPAATPALKGYDWTPSHSVTPPETPEPLSPSSAPRSSLSGAPIDAAKFGLLPKRPVSLLRDPAATGGNSNSGSPPTVSLLPQPTKKLTEDDDGLEYTENPFEERKGPEKK